MVDTHSVIIMGQITAPFASSIPNPAVCEQVSFPHDQYVLIQTSKLAVGLLFYCLSLKSLNAGWPTTSIASLKTISNKSLPTTRLWLDGQSH